MDVEFGAWQFEMRRAGYVFQVTSQVYIIKVQVDDGIDRVGKRMRFCLLYTSDAADE